ncbi:MAG TPA: phospho-N-acetylmuramoyl-pentapeptide-transferase [Tepidisphaeraceae bacterium]|jgi:phospho-N-acetylmuramoyl-pentapeptide-transferase|nr:phospho-N-acetylmuramoyl-pentapeptide-transferase [Tepidisphaeraceae bacterium]
MLYLLIQHFYTWFDNHSLGFLRVFLNPTFQALAAVLLSFFTVLLLGPLVIAWLRKQKIGDAPDFDQADINKLMASKAGTPTMGGLLIIAAITATTLLLADLSNFYVEMALLCVLWLGGVGATDDWLKLTRARRQESGRQGLTSLEKLLFQIGLAIILSYFTYYYGHDIDARNRLYVPFVKNFAPYLPPAAFIGLATFIMVGYSNAVNLTDGLDGLAAGCMAITGFAFIVLSLVVGVTETAHFLLFPYIQASAQMAVLSGAITGSCLGFLWYNCNPARVFMGDTGSLALGGLISYIAIVTRQELMLVLIGGIFGAEALSVMLQVSYFKYTRKKFGEGRRILLMAPLHHHFQKKGWTETQVVTRFWLISAMLAALALATIKLR